MHVLIVEDDEALSRAMSCVLTANKHEVSSAVASRECAALIVQNDPDIIILDLGLDDTQGVETFESIQGLVDDSVPIIVYSASDMWRDECMRLGADGFLVKGEFTPIDLPSIITSAMGHKRLVLAVSRPVEETSWSGQPTSDPSKVGDSLLSMAGEIKALATGG